MKKVINKGYTITVVSWENDGDNYNTKSMTVDSREKAEAIYKLCTTVFISSNNGKGGIGNLDEDSNDKGDKIIIKFMKQYPILWEEYIQEIFDIDEQMIGVCMELYNYELMGCSEGYYSRVCESCTVTYSPEDIFV